MSRNIPDDEIADTVEVSTAARLLAYADPHRMLLLDLVFERAAIVAALAARRPDTRRGPPCGTGSRCCWRDGGHGCG